MKRGKNTTLENIATRTKVYLSQNSVKQQLERVAQTLVKHRQERSKDPDWGFVAVGYSRCVVPGCLNRGNFMRPEDLRKHLVNTHGDLEHASPAATHHPEHETEHLLRKEEKHTEFYDKVLHDPSTPMKAVEEPPLESMTGLADPASEDSVYDLNFPAPVTSPGPHTSNAHSAIRPMSSTSFHIPLRHLGWDDLNAIEYDATTQSLSKIPKERVKSNTHTEVPIKRHKFGPIDDTVDVSIPTSANAEEVHLAARVKLGSLGTEVRWRRMTGNVNSIYVRGIPKGMIDIPRLSPHFSPRGSIITV